MREESDYGAELYIEETMVPLMDPEKWVTKEREVWLITEMEMQHLINVVEYLRDDRIAYGQGWKLPQLEEELERRLRAERIEPGNQRSHVPAETQ